MKVIEALKSSEPLDFDSLDLKLFTFDPANNLEHALSLISFELSTCLYIQRFDFFHKLLLLTSWQLLYSAPSDPKTLHTCLSDLFFSNYFKL